MDEKLGEGEAHKPKERITPPSNVTVREYPDKDAVNFSEGNKEKLVVQARRIIEETEKVIGKQPIWLLRFFPPKSEEKIEARRKLICRELDGHYESEDLRAMKEQGLTLGGIKTPDEEVKKAVNFLVEREMDRRGELKPLVNGYAILDLEGKQVQIIDDNVYSIKYLGVKDLSGVIEYLTNNWQRYRINIYCLYN